MPYPLEYLPTWYELLETLVEFSVSCSQSEHYELERDGSRMPIHVLTRSDNGKWTEVIIEGDAHRVTRRQMRTICNRLGIDPAKLGYLLGFTADDETEGQ